VIKKPASVETFNDGEDDTCHDVLANIALAQCVFIRMIMINMRTFLIITIIIIIIIMIIIIIIMIIINTASSLSSILFYSILILLILIMKHAPKGYCNRYT
jgi:hypothetical protein